MKKNISEVERARNLWAIIVIIWSFYRYKFSLPIWFDEFIAKPLVFILPIYVYITHVEKKDFLSSLWISRKNIIKDLPIGIVIGIMFLISAFLSFFIRDHHNPHLSFSIMSLVIAFAISIMTGISEEIVSRGFILKKLYEESKNMYSSTFTATILFFILHIPILFTMKNLTGESLIFFLMINIILSVINSFLFLTRKSLVLPILISAFYNTAIVLFS